MMPRPVYFQVVRRATSIVFALALAGSLLLGGALAGAADAASRSASALGAAYRAFSAGDYRRALSLARRIERSRVVSRDYVSYLVAQSAAMVGDDATALPE